MAESIQEGISPTEGATQPPNPSADNSELPKSETGGNNAPTMRPAAQSGKFKGSASAPSSAFRPPATRAGTYSPIYRPLTTQDKNYQYNSAFIIPSQPMFARHGVFGMPPLQGFPWPTTLPGPLPGLPELPVSRVPKMSTFSQCTIQSPPMYDTSPPRTRELRRRFPKEKLTCSPACADNLNWKKVNKDWVRTVGRSKSPSPEIRASSPDKQPWVQNFHVRKRWQGSRKVTTPAATSDYPIIPTTPAISITATATSAAFVSPSSTISSSHVLTPHLPTISSPSHNHNHSHSPGHSHSPKRQQSGGGRHLSSPPVDPASATASKAEAHWERPGTPLFLSYTHNDPLTQAQEKEFKPEEKYRKLSGRMRTLESLRLEKENSFQEREQMIKTQIARKSSKTRAKLWN